MPITSIGRDWGVNPGIVRITSTDTLADVVVSDYLLEQADVIAVLNNGAWEWRLGDMVAMSASDGDNFFRFVGNDFNTLVALPSSGGGSTVRSGFGLFGGGATTHVFSAPGIILGWTVVASNGLSTNSVPLATALITADDELYVTWPSDPGTTIVFWISAEASV